GWARSGSAGSSPRLFSGVFSSHMSSGAVEKLAYQKRGGVLSGFFCEALGEREDVALGKIEFHALHAVHGKEDNAGGEGLAVLNLRCQIVERRDIDAAQADAFARKMENRAPEFLARVGQRRNY